MKSVTQFSEQSRVVSRLFPREATGWEKLGFAFYLRDHGCNHAWVLGFWVARPWHLTRHTCSAKISQIHLPRPCVCQPNRVIKNLQWNSLHNHLQISRSWLNGGDPKLSYFYLLFLLFASQPKRRWRARSLCRSSHAHMDDHHPRLKSESCGCQRHSRWPLIPTRNVIAFYRKAARSGWRLTSSAGRRAQVDPRDHHIGAHTNKARVLLN